MIYIKYIITIIIFMESVDSISSDVTGIYSILCNNIMLQMLEYLMLNIPCIYRLAGIFHSAKV